MEIGNEISQKIRSAIKAKLVDLGAYVDDELPDYIMVMVANKKSQQQMTADLNLFLGDNTAKFTAWLHNLLSKLKSVATDPAKDAGTSKAAELKAADEAKARAGKTGKDASGETEEPELTLRPDKDEFEEEQMMTETKTRGQGSAAGSSVSSQQPPTAAKSSRVPRARRPAVLTKQASDPDREKTKDKDATLEPMALSDIDTGIRASLYCLEHGTRREATEEIMKLQRRLRESLRSYQLRLNESQREVRLLRLQIAHRDAEAEAESADVASEGEEEDVSASEMEEEEEAGDSEAEWEDEDEAPNSTVELTQVALITEPISDVEMETADEEEGEVKEEVEKSVEKTAGKDTEAVKNVVQTAAPPASARDGQINGGKDKAATEATILSSGSNSAGLLNDSVENEELDYESGGECGNNVNDQSTSVESSSNNKPDDKPMLVDTVATSSAGISAASGTQEVAMSTEEGEILSQDEEDNVPAPSLPSPASKPHKTPAKVAVSAAATVRSSSTSSSAAAVKSSSTLPSPASEGTHRACGVSGHKPGCSCVHSCPSLATSAKKVSADVMGKGTAKKLTPQNAKGTTSKAKGSPRPYPRATKVPLGPDKPASASSFKPSQTKSSGAVSAAGSACAKKPLSSPSRKSNSDKSSTKDVSRKSLAGSGSSQTAASKSQMTGKTALPSGGKLPATCGNAVTSSGKKSASGVKTVSNENKLASAGDSPSTAKNSHSESVVVNVKRPHTQLSKENGDLSEPMNSGEDPNTMRKKRLKRQMYSDKEVPEERSEER